MSVMIFPFLVVIPGLRRVSLSGTEFSLVTVVFHGVMHGHRMRIFTHRVLIVFMRSTFQL
jgi:hypothetical protein